MAPPPMKKQKRVVVLSSEDESTMGQKLSTARLQVHTTVEKSGKKDNQVRSHSHALPTRSKNEVKMVKQHKTTADRSLRSRPASSTRNSKDKPTTLSKEQKECRPGSLYNFLNTVTQSQRIGTRSDASISKIGNVEDDVIQDDSLDEGSRSWSPGRKSKQDAIGRGKRLRRSFSSNRTEVCKEIHPNASQRFSKAIKRGERTQFTTTRGKIDSRPWAEKYAPNGLDELAVHKRKITDVQRWLDETLTGRHGKVGALIVESSFYDVNTY